MPPELTIYKINDFIRKNASGELDYDRSFQAVREISTAASFHPGHNILIDLRETTLSSLGMEDLMKVVLEFSKLMPYFKNRIANVVPNDERRISIA
jgi:hypothetical protein